MDKNTIELLQRIGLGVLEAVEAAGETGAPGGPLYAAMNAHGASLNQFNSIMDGLVNRGMLARDEWHCYHMTAAGEQFKQALQRKFGPPTSRHCGRDTTSPASLAT